MKTPFVMKVCNVCGRLLVAYSGNFHKDSKKHKYGLRNTCKECRKKHYDDNKETYKQYYEENKEEIKERTKKWKENNQDKIKEYKEKNKDKIRENDRKYYEKNKDKRKQYSEEHKEEIKEKRNKKNTDYEYNEHHKNMFIEKYNGDSYEYISSCYKKGTIYVKAICKQCKKEIEKRIYDYDGNGCGYCSDGISVPEKFIRSLLNDLKEEFIAEYRPNWSSNKRYDFYIPSLNLIIETHGMQHYGNGFEGIGGRTLKEEQENDKYKKELALTNNIDKYIVIDCRHSEFKWLRENTIKELDDVFNLKNIDWNLIWINTLNSIISIVCELWDKGKSVGEISEITKLGKKTVGKYLKNGKDIGICSYTEEESRKRRKKRTEEEQKAINKKQKNTWENKSNKEKEIHRNKISASRLGKNNPKARKIKCIETNEIFECISDAEEKYNSKHDRRANNISKAIRDNRRAYGLHWEYLDEK